MSLLSTSGASVTRKFPVAPESKTAHSLMSLTLKSIVANSFPAARAYRDVFPDLAYLGDVGDVAALSWSDIMVSDVVLGFCRGEGLFDGGLHPGGEEILVGIKCIR